MGSVDGTASAHATMATMVKAAAYTADHPPPAMGTAPVAGQVHASVLQDSVLKARAATAASLASSELHATSTASTQKLAMDVVNVTTTDNVYALAGILQVSMSANCS